MTVLVFLRWPEKCFRANRGDLDYLRSLLPHGTKVVEAKSEREFLRELPAATHAVVWYFRSEWYAKAKRLKAVSTPAAGRELVALPPAGSKVKVHFGHYHGAIISESVVAFCLAWARGFFLKQPEIWPRTWMGDKCFDLAGSKAVIWGFGNVGRAIGEKLETLGVKVEGYSRHRPLTATKLKALRPDWFILALPSDTGTDDIVDAKMLRQLPKHCVLVNVGRGNAVDEAALAKALKAGCLAGAYLDVLKYEPHYERCNGFTETTVKESMPFLEGRIPNCVVMPHASAFSPVYTRKCFEELCDDGFFHS